MCVCEEREKKRSWEKFLSVFRLAKFLRKLGENEKRGDFTMPTFYIALSFGKFAYGIRERVNTGFSCNEKISSKAFLFKKWMAYVFLPERNLWSLNPRHVLCMANKTSSLSLSWELGSDLFPTVAPTCLGTKSRMGYSLRAVCFRLLLRQAGEKYYFCRIDTDRDCNVSHFPYPLSNVKNNFYEIMFFAWTENEDDTLPPPFLFWMVPPRIEPSSSPI